MLILHHNLILSVLIWHFAVRFADHFLHSAAKACSCYIFSKYLLVISYIKLTPQRPVLLLSFLVVAIQANIVPKLGP